MRTIYPKAKFHSSFFQRQTDVFT